MRASLLTAAVLLLLALGFACNAPDAAEETRSAGPDQTAAASAPASSDEEATFWIDGDRWDLAVLACDLSGETDDDTETLRAEGETPGGTLAVTVTRQRLRGSLIHNVSAHIGGAFVAEAQRVFSFDQWESLYGGPAEPLIQIEGDRLTAEGRFSLPDVDQEPMDGRLEAVCSP